MSDPKPGTFRYEKTMRDRTEDTHAGHGATEPDRAHFRPQPGRRQVAPRSKRNDEYGDTLLWSMAEEFERQAYDNGVRLSVGVPYIYKALALSVERSGIRDLVCKDGDSKTVRGDELGVRLVRFFWDNAPWDPDGDVVSEFAAPLMFEDCLKAMQERWLNRRIHLDIQAGRNVRPQPVRKRYMTVFE